MEEKINFEEISCGEAGALCIKRWVKIQMLQIIADLDVFVEETNSGMGDLLKMVLYFY